MENKSIHNDPMDEVKASPWKLILSFIVILGFTVSYAWFWGFLLGTN